MCRLLLQQQLHQKQLFAKSKPALKVFRYYVIKQFSTRKQEQWITYNLFFEVCNSYKLSLLFAVKFCGKKRSQERV